MTRPLILAAMFALAGCNTAQLAATQKTVIAACKLDSQVQPIAVALAPAAGAAVATAASVDAALVHPAVVAACASVGGTPVAVTVK